MTVYYQLGTYQTVLRLTLWHPKSRAVSFEIPRGDRELAGKVKFSDAMVAMKGKQMPGQTHVYLHITLHTVK